MAAHIAAASPGGPRYDPALFPEDRSGILNAIWLCYNCARLIDNDPVRFSIALLHGWKTTAEAEALVAVGKPRRGTNGRRRTAEAEIKRNLQLRKRLQRDLLKPPAEMMALRRPQRPYERFAHGGEAIIRSVTDTTYPRADNAPGIDISGWFKVELYDFYHNGIVVILRLHRGVIDPRGRWKLLRHDEAYDAESFKEVGIWELGRIPWRNLREYDVQGDEYYNIPHLYCDFADYGMPYEDFVYAMLDEDYDWPLDKEKQLQDEGY